MERLLRPRSVALIGGAALERAAHACEQIGYRGALWVVNPNRDELAGHRCFASLAQLPAAPDAAFVAVAREATVSVVRELRAMGAGGVVCYAGGFAEAGADGARLQGELLAAAGELALVGPNSIGLLNQLDGTALWREIHGGRRVTRGAALIAQSGNFALKLTFNGRSLPLAYVVSVGNEAVLDVADFIAAVVDDPRVMAVGIFLEGVAHVDRFSRACAAALAKGTPIVALKVGASACGAAAAAGHTGSLAGADTLYDALFERLGIIRVRSTGELVETLKYLSLSPGHDAHRIALLTCSGGDAALAADLAEAAGLELPALSERTQTALAAELRRGACIGNPLDFFGPAWGDRETLRRCFAAVMQDPGIDAVVLVLDYPASAGDPLTDPWNACLDALVAAHRQSGCPALVTTALPELLPEHIRDRLIAAGVVPLQGLEDTMRAIGASACGARARRRHAAPADAQRLHLPPAAPLPGEPHRFDEWDSKLELERIGLRRPPGVVCSAEQAPAAAAATGFPVAVKALASGLVHKSEAGAVQLGLTDREQTARAVARMRHLSDRFLVEAMVTDVVAEVLVGVKRDERLGLALVVGSGGRLAELVNDVRRLLLPAQHADIARALDALACARLVRGYRGQPSGDRDGLVDTIAAVAAYADATRARLHALEINPLAVLARGRGCVVVDASLSFAQPS